MSCCPSGSVGKATEVSDYCGTVEKWEVGNGEVMDVYVAAAGGSAAKAAPCPGQRLCAKSAVIVFPDIFGISSGRTKQLADFLSGVGFHVVLPDVFLGDPIEDLSTIKAWVPAHPIEPMLPRLKAVFDRLQAAGYARIGSVSFCYGSWLAAHASINHMPLVCCSSMHPSFGIEQFFGGSVEAMLEKTTLPFQLLSAGNDPDNVKPGGSLDLFFQSRPYASSCGIVVYDHMQHGWVNRGDVSDPKVLEAVNDAMTKSVQYLCRVLCEMAHP